MKFRLVAVGHKMPGWIDAGFSGYAKRMPREARIELIEIKPEPRTTGKTVVQMMESEGQRILSALSQNAFCIALDERGTHFSTRQLAQQMQDWMGKGCDVVFIIGGADGLHDSVKTRAQQQMALSALTLPHGLVRILLAEQLYRSYSLLHGHPYHRE